MRTLKKTLCLVLALVMVLGLGAFSVSAVEYEDADEITAAYDEAIQLLAGLNVMQGNNGNFLPKETLDRAAAAVILTKLALGGADVPNMPTTFVDVDEGYAWAENYIGYAQAQGYIKGYNDEYFGPADTLTGAQWGIMLLRVLGYEDAKEDFSSGFELGVAKLVSATKLADGDSGFDVTKPITREEVAQLAFNSLTVPSVSYKQGLGASNGELSTTYEREPANPVVYLAEAFGLKVEEDDATNKNSYDKMGLETDNTGNIFEGIITKNASDDAASGRNETTTVKPVSATGEKVFETATDLDMLGHYVKIYYKVSGGKNVVLSMTDLGATMVEVPAGGIATAANLKKAFGSTLPAKHDNIVDATAFVGTMTDTTYNAADTASAGTYFVYDGKIIAFYEPATVSADKVTKVVTTSGAEAIVLNGAGNLVNTTAGDVVNEYEGIAKDDIVILTVLGDVNNLALAETVTGKITKTSGTDYTFDNGTTYKAETVLDNNSTLTVAAANFTTEFTLYLMPSGTYFAMTTPQGAAATQGSDVYYVKYLYNLASEADEYGQSKNYTYAQAVAMDGTIEKFLVGVAAADDTIDDADGIRQSVTLTAPYLYTFRDSKDPTGAAQELGIKTMVAVGGYSATYTEGAETTNFKTATGPEYKVAIDTTNGGGVFTQSAKNVKDGSNPAVTIYLNSTTGYLFVTGASASALKATTEVGGINMTTAATAIVTKDADGNAVAKAIVVGQAYANAGVTADDIIYVIGDDAPATTAAGKSYTAYNAATGEEIENFISGQSIAASMTGFYNYTTKEDSNGVTVYTVIDATAGGPLNPIVDVAANGNGAHYGEKYTGKVGDAIRSYDDLVDVEAAYYVDLRSAATVTADGVGALTSAAALQSALTNGKRATFDTLKTASGLTVVFVKGTLSTSTTISVKAEDGKIATKAVTIENNQIVFPNGNTFDTNQTTIVAGLTLPTGATAKYDATTAPTSITEALADAAPADSAAVEDSYITIIAEDGITFTAYKVVAAAA